MPAYMSFAVKNSLSANFCTKLLVVHLNLSFEVLTDALDGENDVEWCQF